MKEMMKVSRVILLAIVLLGVGAALAMAQTSAPEKGEEGQSPAGAGQSAEEPASRTEAKPSSQAPYSGNIWHRSTLTGDWFGLRNDLAAKGIIFDMSLTQVGQGVVYGGKDEAWRYGGRGNLTINVDTQKLGLWPGGFFTVEVEGNFMEPVNGKTGALMPVNSNQLYPTPSIVQNNNLNVPNVSFMQFFSPYAGVVLGKLDTTSGDANEFAHGKGDIQFMNLAFNLNPVVALTVPASTLGAGLIILPTKDPKAAIINFLVLQTNGEASTAGFNDLDSDQLTFTGEARVRTNFFGLTGHQLIGGAYSNKSFTSLDQSLRFIIENRAIEKKDGSWNIYYNFDQYLYEPNKGSGQGIGIFGRFGVSDGNPNPMHFFFSFGVGGKGIIPSRPLDRFGIGYYYLMVSNPKLTGPFATRDFLRDEYGFEAFYNIAITPWLQLTPDIQVIRPAQKRVITSGEGIGTATVLGLRLQMVF
ncbi:MAG: carbohydrate porin [Desulfobacterales bacterium]|nr:carbohydrate porin [Desulfobacterales bacterium]